MFAFLAAVLFFVLVASTSALAENRVALVIGNRTYAHSSLLENAERDAVGIGEVLSGLGFETTVVVNGSHEQMMDAVREFAVRGEHADAVLLYYSGHGFQLGGQNYLVPVDATLASIASLEGEAIRLDDILGRVMNRSRPAIVLLDACRNDPRPVSSRGSAMPGLAEPRGLVNTFVAYATAPGAVSYDGGDRPNSPFAEALISRLASKGDEINDMMISVANDTYSLTTTRQTPWRLSTLLQRFWLNPLVLDDERYSAIATMSPVFQSLTLEQWIRSGAQIDEDRLPETLLASLSSSNRRPPTATAETEGAGSGGLHRPPSTAAPLPLPDTQVATLVSPPAPAPSSVRAAPVPSPQEPAEVAPVEPSIRFGTRSEVSLDGRVPTTGGSRRMRPLPPTQTTPTSQPTLRRLVARDVEQDGSEEGSEEEIPEDLASAVQRELERLGCYRSGVDGDFGPGSRRALRDFYNATNSTNIGEEATLEVWRTVRAVPGTVCAAPPPQTQRTPRPSTPQQQTTVAPPRTVPVQPQPEQPRRRPRLQGI